jgi:hypothetical protein
MKKQSLLYCVQARLLQQVPALEVETAVRLPHNLDTLAVDGCRSVQHEPNERYRLLSTTFSILLGLQLLCLLCAGTTLRGADIFEATSPVGSTEQSEDGGTCGKFPHEHGEVDATKAHEEDSKTAVQAKARKHQHASTRKAGAIGEGWGRTLSDDAAICGMQVAGEDLEQSPGQDVHLAVPRCAYVPPVLRFPVQLRPHDQEQAVLADSQAAAEDRSPALRPTIGLQLQPETLAAELTNLILSAVGSMTADPDARLKSALQRQGSPFHMDTACKQFSAVEDQSRPESESLSNGASGSILVDAVRATRCQTSGCIHDADFDRGTLLKDRLQQGTIDRSTSPGITNDHVPLQHADVIRTAQRSVEPHSVSISDSSSEGKRGRVGMRVTTDLPAAAATEVCTASTVPSHICSAAQPST